MTRNEIITEFLKLIEAGKKEQEYQAALEKHPCLIPREFIQNHGIHLSIIFRKLRLAENYITDFFYLAKSSADWNVVFVELEKPTSRYFKDNSDEFHPDFLAGLHQINKWRAWVEASGNAERLFSETLEPIWRPHAMRANPKNFKYILVTGRRSEFAGDDRKARLIRGQERNEEFKILSYDSLLDGARKNSDEYVAIRDNSHIEIMTKEFVDEQTFVWIDPSRLRISQELYDNAIRAKDSWISVEKFGGPKVLESALQKVKIA